MTSQPSESAPAARGGERLRRLNQHVKVLVGLLAVYGPVILVLQLQRRPMVKAYFALGIWAIEGILWYWHTSWVANRRERQAHSRER